MKLNRNHFRLLITISATLFVLILTSCSSTKPTTKNDSFEKVKLFAGTYQDYQLRQYFTTPTLGYWLTFSQRQTDWQSLKDSIQDSQTKVVLIPQDSRTIKIQLEQNGEVFKRKKIKGHYDKEYFYFTIREFSTLLLITSFTRQDVRMKLLENGDLCVDVKYDQGIFLLIFRSQWASDWASGEGSESNMIFKRLKD